MEAVGCRLQKSQVVTWHSRVLVVTLCSGETRAPREARGVTAFGAPPGEARQKQLGGDGRKEGESAETWASNWVL